MKWILPVCILLFCTWSCHRSVDGDQNVETRPYRDAMRALVRGIASDARMSDTDFIVVAQNGQELATTGGAPDGPLEVGYMEALSGQAREELYFGYDNADNQYTPADVTAEWKELLSRIHEEFDIPILVTDYCSSHELVDESYSQNALRDFISFAASDRELGTIPPYPADPVAMNADTVFSLADVHNFLYLINTVNFSTKQEWVVALASTNYDLLIVDAYFEDEALTALDLDQLKHKPGGAPRLVIAYMSIGEAEDYRWYWQADWTADPPVWLGAENPNWEGNYKVEYWNSDWQKILFGQPDSYVHRILSAGFDGVYLDLIDAYEYWE